MNKCLLISYHFPPDAEIGAVRPAELTIHLPEHGWTPIVLTVGKKYYEATDEERYKTLGCKIYRSNKFRNINDIYLFIKAFLKKYSGKHLPPVQIDQGYVFNPISSTESFRSCLLRYYNSLIVYLPDVRGWTFPAVWFGIKIILREKISAIITTSPPTTTQLIGLIIKLLTRRPWIVDFRDPWEVTLKSKKRRSKLSDYLEEKMELAVIKNCDFAVSVTEPMTERLKTKYPQWACKFTTIPNGYDSRSLGFGFDDVRKYDAFTISYIGSLYFGRDPQTFLRAVSEIIQAGSIRMDEINIRFIGNCRNTDGKSVEAMVREMGLGKVVEFIGQVPQSEALREIARSDVALLMAPTQPLQIPGKVYEYLGLKAKILAVCDDGATKDFLKSYPLARVVSPDSLAGMKEAIMSFYRERNSNNDEKMCCFPFEEYERKTITGKIASLLNEVSA